jgi:hypothetical protein
VRDELAERLLSRVMGWDSTQLPGYVGDLQALAQVKYDDYANYGPGAKFLESLAVWLNQFPKERQQLAIDFVMEELVFISEKEMSHLIMLVASEVIAPVLRERIGELSGIEAHRIHAIEALADYERLRRASLVIAASDGARLDRLRRACGLSHEQFLQGPAATTAQIEPLSKKLAKQLQAREEHAPFQHVFFVDDFSGSGRTLTRVDDGVAEGKLVRLAENLKEAASAGYVSEDVGGTVVLYCASEQALEQIKENLQSTGLKNWQVRSVDLLPRTLRVTETNQEMAELCREYVDPCTEDEHKGLVPVGYSECALPLVLAHNTPNNSICLLWMDTRDRPDGKQRCALFPRYERHHPDRP